MYGLRIELPTDEELALAQHDAAFEAPTLHVDCATQVDDALPRSYSPTDFEVASALEERPSRPRSAAAAAAAAAGRSDDESPYLALDDDDDDGAPPDDGADADGSDGDAADDDALRRPLERVLVPFTSGHPTSDLVVNSLSFFRFEQPRGAVGLRAPPLRSNLICVLSVPRFLGSADVIRFLGGHVRYVRHMRLVRDGDALAKRMLLLLFGSPASAERFRREYHGKRFHSLEPETVVAVHVAQVDFAPPRPPSAAPKKLTLELCAASDATVRVVLEATAPPPPPPLASEVRAAVVAAADWGRGGGGRARPAVWPLGAAEGGGLLGPLLGGSTELPSCPVCLERLDPSVSGVFTIVCNHSFHSHCLRRWADSTCPVCRACDDEDRTTSACENCGNTDGVWICLVCAHLGCGRYGCGAGVKHNEQSGHNFAMELATQRVWDYAADNYVHRLIQNKVDGKLVELPDPGAAGASNSADPTFTTLPLAEMGGEGGGPAAAEMKQRQLEQQLDAMEHEYAALLAGQLDVQRAHYEEKLAGQLQELKQKMWEREQSLAEEAKAAAVARDAAAREAKAAAKRAAAAEAEAAKTKKELDFNKQLNEQVMRNQADLREQVAAARAAEAAAKAEVAAAQDDLRDLTFHLEAQAKIVAEGGGGGELSGGDLAGVTPKPERRKGKGKVRT